MTHGARVLVTRAAQDAPALARRLIELGLEPVLVPLLDLQWDPMAVADVAHAHPAVDHVLVTSGVAADVLAVGAPNAWRSARWAAVGPGTAERLARHGLPCATVPERATARDLTASLGPLAGKTVVYPRSELADPDAVQRLEAAGATVVEVVAYRNVAPRGFVERLQGALPVRVTTLLSSSAAERLAEGVPAERRAELGSIVVLGPSTADAARHAGLAVAAVAQPHTLDGLVRAVVAVLGS